MNAPTRIDHDPSFATPTPADLAITVRDGRFGRGEEMARWWCGGDPIATAWNNSLSVAQQSLIMRTHGAKIELFDNIKSMFVKKKTQG